MHKFTAVIILTSLVFLSACTSNNHSFDASGSFEAVETIISSEATGIIKEFKIEEGQVLKAGDNIGYIDTTQLYLRKKQLKAQVKSLNNRLPDIPQQTQYFDAQTATAQTQLQAALNERKRYENLVKGDAATQKQLDDINSQIDVLKKQIEALQSQKSAQQSALNTNSMGLQGDRLPLQVQIEQLDDQISKSKIINPIDGTVLSKYAVQNEMTSTGKPLYKIADLSTIILRAYISGDQLSHAKLNQKVKVLTDDGNGGFKEAEGTIIWINDKAEFTPKTIQTKNERANMVYAIKVKMTNDGTYKIGMYGEIEFKEEKAVDNIQGK